MEMTRFEKFFVNRERKGLGNLGRVRRLLERVDAAQIRDVLEIGCGIGTVSARLSDDFGWNVTGTDFDQAQIDEAKARYPEAGGLRFRREDATRMSFSADSFDLAIGQMVFHHIPGWRDAVKELARVVRPGGIVIWQDFVFSRGFMRIARPLARSLGICAREDVIERFRETGFEILSVRPRTPVAVSFTELLLKNHKVPHP